MDPENSRYNFNMDEDANSNPRNPSKTANKNAHITRRVICRYGPGCTHTMDPSHREKFWHPNLPKLNDEQMKSQFICNECGFATGSLPELQLHIKRKTAWSHLSLIGCRISCLVDFKEWHEGHVMQYHKSGKHFVEFRLVNEKRWLVMKKIAFYIVERPTNNNVNDGSEFKESIENDGLAPIEDNWVYVEDISLDYAYAQSVLFKIYGYAIQETGHLTKGHVCVTEVDRANAQFVKGSLLYGELLPRGANKAFNSKRLDAEMAGSLFDLGMGTGKIAMQAFLQYKNLNYVYGVELAVGRYRIAEEAALKMVELLGPENFHIQIDPGKYIIVTEINSDDDSPSNLASERSSEGMESNKYPVPMEVTGSVGGIGGMGGTSNNIVFKLIADILGHEHNIKNVNTPRERDSTDRILYLECGNMFNVRNIYSADVVMMETDVPSELHDDLFLLLGSMQEGARILTYLDIRKVWNGSQSVFPFRQLDCNRHLSDRYPTSWSVQRGHHFFLWTKTSGSFNEGMTTSWGQNVVSLGLSLNGSHGGTGSNGKTNNGHSASSLSSSALGFSSSDDYHSSQTSSNGNFFSSHFLSRYDTNPKSKLSHGTSATTMHSIKFHSNNPPSTSGLSTGNATGSSPDSSSHVIKDEELYSRCFPFGFRIRSSSTMNAVTVTGSNDSNAGYSMSPSRGNPKTSHHHHPAAVSRKGSSRMVTGSGGNGSNEDIFGANDLNYNNVHHDRTIIPLNVALNKSSDPLFNGTPQSPSSQRNADLLVSSLSTGSLNKETTLSMSQEVHKPTAPSSSSASSSHQYGVNIHSIDSESPLVTPIPSQYGRRTYESSRDNLPHHTKDDDDDDDFQEDEGTEQISHHSHALNRTVSPSSSGGTAPYHLRHSPTTTIYSSHQTGLEGGGGFEGDAAITVNHSITPKYGTTTGRLTSNSSRKQSEEETANDPMSPFKSWNHFNPRTNGNRDDFEKGFIPVDGDPHLLYDDYRGQDRVPQATESGQQGEVSSNLSSADNISLPSHPDSSNQILPNNKKSRHRNGNKTGQRKRNLYNNHNQSGQQQQTKDREERNLADSPLMPFSFSNTLYSDDLPDATGNALPEDPSLPVDLSQGSGSNPSKETSALVMQGEAMNRLAASKRSQLGPSSSNPTSPLRPSLKGGPSSSHSANTFTKSSSPASGFDNADNKGNSSSSHNSSKDASCLIS